MFVRPSLEGLEVYSKARLKFDQTTTDLRQCVDFHKPVIAAVDRLQNQEASWCSASSVMLSGSINGRPNAGGMAGPLSWSSVELQQTFQTCSMSSHPIKQLVCRTVSQAACSDWPPTKINTPQGQSTCFVSKSSSSPRVSPSKGPSLHLNQVKCRTWRSTSGEKSPCINEDGCYESCYKEAQVRRLPACHAMLSRTVV